MPKHLTVDDESEFITSEVLGAANGVATLGEDGKVLEDQLPAVLTGSVDSVNGKIGNVALTADDVGALPVSSRGTNNGVASLDSTGHVVTAQLPGTLVQTSSLGVANGVATLGADGKLTGAQVPTPPVTSVAGKTGAVTLAATDVGAIPATQKGAASGVATLDASSKVPSSQIPSLVSLYQPIPESTPTKPGQQLTAVAGGSNSTQWADPLVYTASSLGAMPTGVPTGALCVRTDIGALYRYTGSAWVAQVPQDPDWTNLSLPSGTRGYNTNQAEYIPKYKRIGNVVWLKGRIELTNGNNFATGYSLSLPSIITPTSNLDLIAAATTSGGQLGIARWQINTDGSMVFFPGTGGAPPNSPWLGLVGTYRLD